MTAGELMARLESPGIGFVADEERLRVSAARSQLTEELKVAIGAQKAELSGDSDEICTGSGFMDKGAA